MSVDDVATIKDHVGMTAYGRAFAEVLRAGDVVLLHGDLGAGKTTLAQGIAAGLNVGEDVQSPTFAIVAEHTGADAAGSPIRFYHLDLYRLENPEQLEALGYEQFIEPVDGVSIIEWPERAGGLLPDRFWLLRISDSLEGGRMVRRSWYDSRD